ncbi:MAG: restriction endonuclease subunit S [Methanococcoides sp.]|nr:restriction endonuclease subunit S [Methanococcoides sp.]
MSSDTQHTEYGKMSASFSQEILAKLCLEKNGVQTGPFGSQLHNEDYVLMGTPIITVEHLGDNRITYQNMPLVSDEDKARLSKYCIEEGDIVFSRVGSVDRRALVRQEEDGWLFSGRCLRVRVDKTKIDPVYLSYFFGFEGFKNYIKSIAVGATMPSINTKILSNLPIYYPNLETQSKIGQILQKLDDKIELNNQINQNLEAMAQAIFKSWFVDFEPVKAKIAAIEAGEDAESVNRAAMRAISGRSDEGLDKMQAEQPEEYAQLKGTAELFPAAMWDSELGEVPEGWRVGKFNDLVENVKHSLKSGNYLQNRKYVPIECLPMNQIGIDDYKDFSEAKSSLIAFENGDILFGAMRAYFHRVNFASFSGVTRTTVFVLRPKDKNYFSYSLFLLNQNSSVEYANAYSRGTTIPYAVWDKGLADMPVIIPSEKIVEQYNVYMCAFLDKINQHMIESKILKELRDFLLPKLLSGELSVENIKLDEVDA